MPPVSNILVVDDDKIMRITLKNALLKRNYNVSVAEDAIEGLKKFDESDFDIAVIDLKLPGMDGIEFLKRIKVISPDTSVIIITAYGTIETAVEAMKMGADDYVTKPFNPEELFLKIKKIETYQGLVKKNIGLQRKLDMISGNENIVISKNRKMQRLYRTIETVAATDTTVLIRGESGTGKTVVARMIHNKSHRRGKPFIEVSCAALVETLLESELFGHKKGAFTGAIKERIGRFKLADKGTIFLDDIDGMSLSTQAKLLRVLQERKFEPVGGTETVDVDVRVIAASNVDLQKAIEKKKFRDDLFYRLNVVSIDIPPLRERTEDIPVLVRHFLKIYNQKMEKRIEGFSHQAIELLMNYRWPGNVRELENAVEHVVALSKNSVILPGGLPNIIKKSKTKRENKKRQNGQQPSLKDVEKNYIISVLKLTDGHKSRAAKILGISRKNLWEKIKRYGIQNRYNK